MMNYFAVDEIIFNALREDIPSEDISTNAVINESSRCQADLYSKDYGVLAGVEVFERVFILLGNVSVEICMMDGSQVKPGDLIAKLKGSTRNILKGERTALNLLQRISGIAGTTREYADKIKHTNARLLDTRKTTPGLRLLEKYAVTIGGGCNHRFNLSDGVMLKDNHISAAGGITAAVEKARKSCSFVRKIEVETENLDMVQEALEAGADIIMLDNMNIQDMKMAVQLIAGRAITEASGNVSLHTIKDIAETGVDFISCGALTHSFKALDLSLKNLKIVYDV